MQLRNIPFQIQFNTKYKIPKRLISLAYSVIVTIKQAFQPIGPSSGRVKMAVFGLFLREVRAVLIGGESLRTSGFPSPK